MKLLLDPAVFNYVILSLYSVNMMRWAYEKQWPDAMYWAAAFLITVSVTWKSKVS